MRPRWTRASARFGLALAPDSICAVRLDPLGRPAAAEDPWLAPLSPPASDGTWPALEAALAELRTAAGSARVRARVALLPPWSETRRLELPPLARAELKQILERDVARYFPAPTGAAAITVRRLRRGDHTRPAVIASAAPAALIDLLRATAAAAGIEVETVVPAVEAWAVAATRIWPVFRARSGWLAVHAGARVELLELRRGRMVRCRRFPAGAAAAEQLVSALRRVEPPASGGTAEPAAASAPSLIAVLEDRPGEPLRATIEAAGFAPSLPAARCARLASPAALAAALAAGRPIAPYRTALIRGEMQRRRRRAAVVDLIIAAALVAVAAYGQIAIAEKQTATFRAERERLRPRMAEARRERVSLARVVARAAVVQRLEEQRPDWAAAVADLAQCLPSDSYLTSFHAAGDSVVVEGEGAHTADVLSALTSVPGFDTPVLTAPIRRQQASDGVTRDHFSIRFRFRSPPTAQAQP